VDLENEKQLKIDSLVKLKNHAAGYPMIADPQSELGIGLIVEHGHMDFDKNSMVKVLWSKSKTKRWEFVEDLIIL
jgi:hypothetical protein